jgi:hypothetical protein
VTVASGTLPELLVEVETRVRRAVEARRAVDPNPDDRFRGLYVSDAHVDELLARATRDSPAAPDRVERLVSSFGLTPLDVHLLLVALAPDLDPRFERLYGYLNDDVTRRRATVGLALQLCEQPLTSAGSRARLTAGAPLVDRALMVVEDPDRPLLSRALRVPDRVVAYVLGDDRPDATISRFLADAPTPPDGPAGGVAQGVSRALLAGATFAYVRDRAGGAPRSIAAAALRGAGLDALVLDLEPLAASSAEDLEAAAVTAGREAGLRGAGLVAGPVDSLIGPNRSRIDAFTRLRCPCVLYGRAPWDPSWSRVVPALGTAPVPDEGARLEQWSRASGLPPDTLGVRMAAFRLDPEGIATAVDAARLHAVSAGRDLDTEDLLIGARTRNTAALDRLAVHVAPRMGWEGLVLPAEALSELHDLVARARNRGTVLGSWGMRPGGGRGHGVTALFAGDPGTGKTLAAEVVAHDLGLDLYTVNLATVVDKYIGETEKNLERIFTEAEGVNGVILFDEADALFGKRTEISDARDRHANIEVAYLLQRLERFDGLGILATNLRGNVDEAFARRLDAVVEFPVPDVTQRRALWELCLPTVVPRAEGIDLDFCAGAFEMAGGAIRSACVTACYLAADRHVSVSMAEIIHGVRREYRKLGRLLLASEFAPYWP